ncbi:PssE/Cps14G family polysaccharide biosynthesis glycosyltransferase [Halobacillus campisalis]|uniref:PssE/Cps14G family polysaccharide biosynthesis glycosyltransferase n=1 Tax=Halobacillus campisalis TaxID=435909 RepID=A0ABW2K4W3_9BACI|nr:PssE/Cps14G family polysaccharide biosynthesis glycosyltransferase [Halobacillus campisalis]
MIFVVLGTHELQFRRLLAEVERLKKAGVIQEEVVVQNGNTSFESDVLTLKPFVTYDEMDALFDQADLVVTHAGTGSVTTALKKGKKVIAAARLKEYGEHNDDHQLELIEVFLEQGYILNWGKGEDLEDVLHQVDSFNPPPFQSGKTQMIQLIKDFIEKS